MTDVQAWMREKKNRVLTARFLREIGFDGSDQEVEQIAVALEALAVFEERNALYRDGWYHAGAIDNLRNARRKVSRQMNIATVVCEKDPPALADGNLDDAIDVINYTTFAVRNMRFVNFDGTPEKE